MTHRPAVSSASITSDTRRCRLPFICLYVTLCPENNTCVHKTSLTALLDEVLRSHQVGVSSAAENTSSWDILSSIFFATTVVSTIGITAVDFAMPG